MINKNNETSVHRFNINGAEVCIKDNEVTTNYKKGYLVYHRSLENALNYYTVCLVSNSGIPIVSKSLAEIDFIRENMAKNEHLNWELLSEKPLATFINSLELIEFSDFEKKIAGRTGNLNYEIYKIMLNINTAGIFKFLEECPIIEACNGDDVVIFMNTHATELHDKCMYCVYHHSRCKIDFLDINDYYKELSNYMDCNLDFYIRDKNCRGYSKTNPIVKLGSYSTSCVSDIISDIWNEKLSSLEDFPKNKCDVVQSFKNTIQSKESIFSQYSDINSHTLHLLTRSVLDFFDTTELRLEIFQYILGTSKNALNIYEKCLNDESDINLCVM